MYLPPLRSLNPVENCLLGDVVVHPSARIAPGVILQAAPDSRIIIGEGVCLGMGAIVNACGGTIELKNGAVIGAGVLIIGASTIGERACIGTATTIFNADINTTEIIPAATIIGDTSRQVSLDLDRQEIDRSPPNLQLPEIPLSQSKDPALIDNSAPENEVSQTEVELEEPATEEPEELARETNTTETAVTEKSENTAIFGKVYVNQLLVNLFPQGQNLNSPPKEQK